MSTLSPRGLQNNASNGSLILPHLNSQLNIEDIKAMSPLAMKQKIFSNPVSPNQQKKDESPGKKVSTRYSKSTMGDMKQTLPDITSSAKPGTIEAQKLQYLDQLEEDREKIQQILTRRRNERNLSSLMSASVGPGRATMCGYIGLGGYEPSPKKEQTGGMFGMTAVPNMSNV